MTRWLLLASAALGLLVTFTGVILFFAPDLAANLYGLPKAENPVWQHVAGARELTVGLLILVFAATKQLRALAFLMLVLAPIPMIDFYLAYTHDAGLMALQHAPGGPGMIAIGLLLLRKDK